MSIPLIAVGLSLAGCTSAPIDLSRADVEAASEIDMQGALRRAANQLTELVDDNNWSASGDSGAATRRFLGRLIGGGDEADEQPSAVADYVSADGSAPERLRADLAQLTRETQALAQLSIRVASSDTGLSQDSLAADIAATESALAAVRRAKSFFLEVSEAVVLDMGVDAEMSELQTAVQSLAMGADALAERRWAARSGLFG